MEEWLQTEWWDWKVYVANLTEQYAQIAVVGPEARRVLERLGGMDLSADALSFMHWAEGELGGIPARVFRISFSGELSYEIAVPAGQVVDDPDLVSGGSQALAQRGADAPLSRAGVAANRQEFRDDGRAIAPHPTGLQRRVQPRPAGPHNHGVELVPV